MIKIKINDTNFKDEDIEALDYVMESEIIYTSKNVKVETTNDENEYLEKLMWRGIESINDVCEKCQGSGIKTYANTTTWRGGIGGQALTNDVCNECWGTGSNKNKGINLKEISIKLNELKKLKGN